jgi:hypothetical protein
VLAQVLHAHGGVPGNAQGHRRDRTGSRERYCRTQKLKRGASLSVLLLLRAAVFALRLQASLEKLQ